jgi:hypothetical protein
MGPANEELYRKERFSFRFINLSEDMAARVRYVLPTVRFKAPRSSLPQSGPGLVLSFDLNETMDLAPLHAILSELTLSPGTYGVWISLVTSADHGGVAVPTYILDLVRETRCGIDFSFVSCLDSLEATTESNTGTSGTGTSGTERYGTK